MLKTIMSFSRVITLPLLLSFSTSQAINFVDGNFKFSTNKDGTCTVTGTTLSSGELNLPSTATYEETIYKVTNIGDSAFYFRRGFTGRLTLPEGLTRIGADAFYGCRGFTGITLPKGLTSIGKEAFAYCRGFTGNLTLPEGLTGIGDNAFEYCSGFTGSLTFPESVTYIGNYAFEGCSGFTGNLTIPTGLTYLGSFTFSNCSGFNGSLTLPDGLTIIGNGAFAGCRGFTGNLVLPEGLTNINYRVFSGCSGFTSLTLPEGLTWISNDAFRGCSGFTGSLTLPEGLTTICGDAFRGCSGFTGSLILPKGLTRIEARAFLDTNFSKVIAMNPEPITLDLLSVFFSSNVLTNSPLIVPEGSGQKYKNANRWRDFRTILESDPDQKVTEITITPSTAEIRVGDNICLSVMIKPIIAGNQRVIWRSSDDAVAKVNADGLVRAIAPGSVTITATTTDGSNLSANSQVIVNPILVEGITLNLDEAYMIEGESVQLTATVKPDNATDKSVTWSSSDESVATVDATGLVKSIKVGSATITATTADGSNLSANCLVTVNPIPAESITLNLSKTDMIEGESMQLTATVSPDNATDKSVAWISSDEAVATVNENGIVTAVAAGSATITAKTANGLGATCTVTVKAKVIDVASITLNVDKAELVEGTTTQLTATVTPDNATDQSVTWSSSDESVAKVDANGLVKGITVGPATITATTANGLKATCTVTVKAKVIDIASITLNVDKAELVEGTTTQLTATISPDNATDKSVTWSSSDEAVATVNADGLVTAVAAGSAIITAKTANGLAATCAVTVKAKVVATESITLNMDKAELVEGTATQLTATVTPDNATDKSVIWSSSDEAVATVNANGLVTAVAAGSATITATTANGLKATCAVTVTAKQSGIEGVEADSAGVRVEGNSIIVPEGSKVYDLSGREVTPSALTPGIYIVRIPGGKAVKVRV